MGSVVQGLGLVFGNVYPRDVSLGISFKSLMVSTVGILVSTVLTVWQTSARQTSARQTSATHDLETHLKSGIEPFNRPRVGLVRGNHG